MPFVQRRQNAERIVGCIATHGHEDHIGALPDLFLELDAKIYGLPLPIALAQLMPSG